MLRYTIKRVLLMFPTLLGAAVLVFFLLRIVPGDICEVRFGGVEGGTYDTEAVEICREQNGLNEPLSVQFGRFIAGVLTLDLGVSMWSKHPIVDELGQRLPLSIQLTLMAMVVSIIIGIPLGIVAALRQDTWLDYLARSFSVVGIAVPSFWFGIMIIVGLLVSTHVLFDQPWMPPLEYTPFFDDPISNLEQMIWPALAVGYRFSASLTRWTRSARRRTSAAKASRQLPCDSSMKSEANVCIRSILIQSGTIACKRLSPPFKPSHGIGLRRRCHRLQTIAHWCRLDACKAADLVLACR